MGPEGALSSDEVNFLIYRHLLEAGFTHSAFVFGCESSVQRANIDGKDVPMGALVSFIQKGFQFMELEANLNNDGSDVYGKYTSLTARDILTKDLGELRELARELKTGEAQEKGPAVSAPCIKAEVAQPLSAEISHGAEEIEDEPMATGLMGQEADMGKER